MNKIILFLACSAFAQLSAVEKDKNPNPTSPAEAMKLLEGKKWRMWDRHENKVAEVGYEERIFTGGNLTIDRANMGVSEVQYKVIKKDNTLYILWTPQDGEEEAFLHDPSISATEIIELTAKTLTLRDFIPGDGSVPIVVIDYVSNDGDNSSFVLPLTGPHRDRNPYSEHERLRVKLEK